MLPQAIGNVLPAAVAVALSPIPIIAVVLVLGSQRARTAGPTFALGWVAGLGAVSVLVIVVFGGADEPDSTAATGVSWLHVALGVLFLVMAARQWSKRPKHGEPTVMPKWMAAVDSMPPTRTLVLGAALSGANPKNVALTIAAAASIAEAGLDDADTAVAVAVYVALGSVTVVGAVLFSLVAPNAASRRLSAVKEFMSDHNAVIMAIVLLLLGANILGDGLGGLGR